ncbi:MAG: double-cubane-cluster-containing anaerobic reductase [Methanosarcinales archaeon]
MEAFKKLTTDRVKELLEKKTEGKKIIGTLCLFVPDELIYAAGADRVILCGGRSAPIPTAERYLPRNICPLIKSTFGSVIEKKCIDEPFTSGKACPHFDIVDMIIAEATCDGKKKMYELLNQYIPTFILDLPQHPQTPSALEYWITELNNLKKVLEKFTGNKINSDNIKNAIQRANETRKLLHRMYELRSYPNPPISGVDAISVVQLMHYLEEYQFQNALRNLCKEMEKKANKGICRDTPRIMISGCPIAAGNMKVPELIENTGGIIVVEESCTGTRAFWDLVSETKAPMNALAERYLNIPCACMFPNEQRIKHILELVKTFKVDGVVYYTLQFCHSYNIEKYKIQKALKNLGIPVLGIETDYDNSDVEQLKTRIQAFLEMLMERKL